MFLTNVTPRLRIGAVDELVELLLVKLRGQGMATGMAEPRDIAGILLTMQQEALGVRDEATEGSLGRLLAQFELCFQKEIPHHLLLILC